jgi:hypothetical protein
MTPVPLECEINDRHPGPLSPYAVSRRRPAQLCAVCRDTVAANPKLISWCPRGHYLPSMLTRCPVDGHFGADLERLG